TLLITTSLALSLLYAQTPQPRSCDNIQKQLTVAEQAQARGEWQTALASYQDAERISPTCAEAIVNMGTVYNRLNQPEQAIAAFQRAIALSPRLAAAHLN